ncbi:MAG: bifunctional (p)ppGpp synthetase/guanosine-3',5'-bis(diphosphate) 3'-pyrophosphohydrolase [Reichenbachiella sp.]|uniref:RelA/SpoT family protein n=1 Tax=Reichenbachiella sp. TaxID=2184521 RepID=UPI0029664F1F|nr:bifunctional (p)ppGpp synthetase/guanosine-3',5'-bis(diphosphate) 3'-pyrophosphohydrolase [Reichenbachiella sp.]MDW3211407.1 bifunctional (p)ppGpp synthetase/guanosine-3',5'-bis(diphosphate) 3'-pyrophosphohydrolase [Reichenbachiella sp.]
METTMVIDEEEEKKEIIRRYRKLLRHAKPFLKDNDAKEIKKAFYISVEAHKDMRRKSGEPYIYHPLEVADICVNEIGLGTTSIISALLHDVVEDTDWELEDIRREFGPKIMRIIDGLTKISGVPGQSVSEQAENFRKMLLTLSSDTRVILIKLADRLHNMRTLESMPRHKQLKIASETFYLYAPLAHRLGLYAIKTELEDLSMKYREADDYNGIAEKIEESKDDRNKFIRNFIRPIQKSINDQGYAVEVKGRTKSIYSIAQKMKKQDIPFEEVFDLFAIRIIIDTDLEKEKAACWHVYSIVTDFYQPNPDRLRDWVSIPKANGYESLHTTVMTKKGQWVEVQIRTRRMDDIAEKGYAAHWKYKDGSAKENESALDMWINRVRESLEQNDISAIEFVDDFRSNLFLEEVYAFTPMGKLITLPNGSTALDFAFDVHSEVGANCIGAKINHKLVPINTKLKNGDQVEILTSSKQKPKEDWLRFVVSSKAKSGIKDFLKEEKKKAAFEGKEIVIRKLKQIKLTLNNDTINRLVAYFGSKSPLDFFFAVGSGKIDSKDIKKISEIKKESPKKHKRMLDGPEEVKKTIKQVHNTGTADMLLIGEDMDVVDYKFANCCKPIPGDDVFGFVTVSEGIKIHRTSCPNATELMSNYGYRIIKAKWTSQQQIAFLAGIKVIGTDRIGMVNDITSIISTDLKVNMRSLTIDTDHGIFEGNISVYVDDTSHLNTMLDKLKKVEGIESVSRFDLYDK